MLEDAKRRPTTHTHSPSLNVVILGFIMHRGRPWSQPPPALKSKDAFKGGSQDACGSQSRLGQSDLDGVPGSRGGRVAGARDGEKEGQNLSLSLSLLLSLSLSLLSLCLSVSLSVSVSLALSLSVSPSLSLCLFSFFSLFSLLLRAKICSVHAHEG